MAIARCCVAASTSLQPVFAFYKGVQAATSVLSWCSMGLCEDSAYMHLSVQGVRENQHCQYPDLGGSEVQHASVHAAWRAVERHLGASPCCSGALLASNSDVVGHGAAKPWLQLKRRVLSLNQPPNPPVQVRACALHMLVTRVLGKPARPVRATNTCARERACNLLFTWRVLSRCSSHARAAGAVR